MKLLMTSLLLLALAACNSGTNNQPAQSAAQPGARAAGFSWTPEDENEFLASCMDSATVRLGEATAFSYCKCVLGQLEASFPNMDSAATVLMDRQRAASFVDRCNPATPTSR
jgi:hypothetical protein